MPSSNSSIRSTRSSSPSRSSIATTWTPAEFHLVGVIFGFTLGFGYFVICHAVRQTRHINVFTVLVWLGISANLVSSCLTFFFSIGVYDGFASYFICVILLWAIQLHCILQVMISRIALIWSSPFHVLCLRWGMFAWTLSLNMIVFCTWIPARLQVSNHFIQVDAISYRIVRITCLVTNAFLNAQFIYSVNKTLVSNGLHKYKKLLRLNSKMMFLSLILDLLPIILLISRSSLLFVSFFPLATMVKMKTELLTNDLISEIVHSEHPLMTIAQSQTENSTAHATYDSTFKHTRIFSQEEAPRSLTTKNITALNLADVWKPPNMSFLLTTPPGLQMSNRSTGSFIHVDDMVDSSIPAFAPLSIYSPSLGIRSERWPHSRMSTYLSSETDVISDIEVAHSTIEMEKEEKTPKHQVT